MTTRNLLPGLLLMVLLVPCPIMAETVTEQTGTTRTAPAPPPAPPPPPQPPPASPAVPVRPTPPPPPAPPVAPQKDVLPAGANIRVDLSIADAQGTQTGRKTVSMLIRNGSRSSIRSTGEQRVVLSDGQIQDQPVRLNIDAQATLVGEDTIRVWATFELTTPSIGLVVSGPGGPVAAAQVTQMIDVDLQNGRTLLVSRSADPLTDRTVTVELTATVLRP
jgi:hypothetical protein